MGNLLDSLASLPNRAWRYYQYVRGNTSEACNARQRQVGLESNSVHGWNVCGGPAMFCPKCGTAQAVGSAFCHKCGHEIPKEIREFEIEHGQELPASKPSSAPGLGRYGACEAGAKYPVHAMAPQPGKLSKIPSVAPTKRQIANSVFAAVLICLTNLSVIAPAFDGHQPDFKGDGAGFVVVNAICFWYLFKSRGYRGWLGGIFGVVFSFIAAIGAGAIAARAQNSPDAVIAQSQLLAALRKAHPKEYAAIENELVAAMDRGAQQAEIQTLANAKIMPLTYRAILTASDGAMLEYSRAKIRMFRDVAAKSTEDCVLLISGNAAEAGPGVLTRILSGVPQGTQTAVKNSLARVIEESGDLDAPADPEAGARFDALYEQIDARLKAEGSSAYFLGDEKKSADVRCKAGLGILEEAQKLPTPDRTFILRQLLGSG